MHYSSWPVNTGSDEVDSFGVCWSIIWYDRHALVHSLLHALVLTIVLQMIAPNCLPHQVSQTHKVWASGKLYNQVYL